MRTLLPSVLRLYRRARFVRWTLLLRLRLRWWGMRLEIDAPEAPVLAGLPLIEVVPGERRGGLLRLRFGRGVRLGAGVELQVRTGVGSALELGDLVRVASAARFRLQGGAIRIDDRTQVRDFVVLKSSGELHVGPGCILSFGSIVHCEEAVTLGEDVNIAERVTVVDSDHRFDHRRRGSIAHKPVDTDPVALDRGTLIFAGSIVLAGTVTGPGCVIGAGALVRGRYPAGALLLGAPARVVSEVSDARPV